MNNKIRALAAQATAFCCEEYKDHEGSTAWLWEEKFGELIIEECIKSIDDYDPDYILTDLIEKHFGIEEYQ